jgi:hypothetical protein
MERLSPIDEKTLTADQKRGYDELISRFGIIAGPFGVWLRSASCLNMASNFRKCSRHESNSSGA